jgi:hypothetical protein
MTKANFIIIESPYAQFIDKYFLSKDLVLRKFNKLFNNFLRYTISDKKTNDLFINLCLECDDYINRNLPRLRNNTSYSCLKKDLFSDESNRESYDETKVSGISKEIIEYATQSRISRLFVIQGGNKILEEELRSHGKNLEILSGKLTSLDKCNFGKIINS